MKQPTKKEKLIVEEYLYNGFSKVKAYKTQYPNLKPTSLRTEAYKFFNKPHIKEYAESRVEDIMESSKQLTNKMLINLEYDCFERDVDEEFSWREKQNSQKLMISLLKGLDKDGNLKEDNVIEVCIIEEDGTVFSPNLSGTKANITENTVVFDERSLED